MLKIRLDTDFFFELLFKNKIVIDVWDKIINSQAIGIISSIVIFELKRLSYKKDFLKTNWDNLINPIEYCCNVISLDKAIAIEAAEISHGTGLPTADALILIYTTYKINKCNVILTRDKHFLIPKSKEIEVILLQ